MIKIIVNGTFDLFHNGHLELLNYAKGMGQNLLVAIDTDRRVAELKGADRPIHSQEFRMKLLANLKAVDEVQLFDSDEELERIMMMYDPDIMVKGSDYRTKPIVGAKYCKIITFFERINEHSTTSTIQSIINRR